MSKPKLCMDCKARAATVPDRNRVGRPNPRRCGQCHADLLRGDMARVFNTLEQKVKEPQ